MSTVVKMPQLGESIVEGTVARWLKAPGERVAKMEPLLEISTDKIDTEVPAPANGVLLEIVVPEGTTVETGAALAFIGEPDAEAVLPHAEFATPKRTPAAPKPLTTSVAAPARPLHAADKPSGRAFISPVVSRIAAEHQIDLDRVPGSGLGGRITKKDVVAFVEQRQLDAGRKVMKEREEIREMERAERAASTPQSPIAQSDNLTADETLQPLTAIRRAIAQHMVQSKRTSPHVTSIFEVDMTEVVRHREANKESFAFRGVKLTFTPYFVAAAAVGLRAAPQVNSRFTEAGIVVNRRIHIGVAVAIRDGLIVPVIHDADEKNLQGLARAVNDLADRARSGRLNPDEVKGGAFTVTNHGVGGSIAGTPIINQPQAGVLGVGAIVKRPVVRSSNASLLPSADDAIVIRPMCYLSLSFDHRILDGAQADAFLTVVKETLENWGSSE